MSDFGTSAESQAYDRWLEAGDKDPGTWNELDALTAELDALTAGLEASEARYAGLYTAAQLTADTMAFWNDTGEFDEALAALAAFGIRPEATDAPR